MRRDGKLCYHTDTNVSRFMPDCPVSARLVVRIGRVHHSTSQLLRGPCFRYRLPCHLRWRASQSCRIGMSDTCLTVPRWKVFPWLLALSLHPGSPNLFLALLCHKKLSTYVSADLVV